MTGNMLIGGAEDEVQEEDTKKKKKKKKKKDADASGQAVDATSQGPREPRESVTIAIDQGESEAVAAGQGTVCDDAGDVSMNESCPEPYETDRSILDETIQGE